MRLPPWPGDAQSSLTRALSSASSAASLLRGVRCPATATRRFASPRFRRIFAVSSRLSAASAPAPWASCIWRTIAISAGRSH